MVNNIFKALYLIVFICFTLILFGIYRNMENNHFEYTNEGAIIDKNTNIRYIWIQGQGYHYLTKDGKIKPIDSLPE